MGAFEDAFANYFGTPKTEDTTGVIANTNDETYTYREEMNPKLAQQTMTISSSLYEKNTIRQAADGNIDTIDQLAYILKKLLNAAWGVGWGEISPDLKTGEDSSKPILPQITI